MWPGTAAAARWQKVPRPRRRQHQCWWRRRTGIEPASDAARRSLVLKTRGTTRNPDASADDSTDSSEWVGIIKVTSGRGAGLAVAPVRQPALRVSGTPEGTACTFVRPALPLLLPLVHHPVVPFVPPVHMAGSSQGSWFAFTGVSCGRRCLAHGFAAANVSM